MDSLIISSLKLQGLGNLQKRRDIFHYLKQKCHSIYCLQDTHFDKKIEKYVTSEWGYKDFFLHHISQIQEVFYLVIT